MNKDRLELEVQLCRWTGLQPSEIGKMTYVKFMEWVKKAARIATDEKAVAETSTFHDEQTDTKDITLDARHSSALEEIDMKILRELDKCGHALKLVDLAMRVSRNRDTCSGHLNKNLIPAGYVEHVGKRGGVAITPAGRGGLNVKPS